MRLTFTKISKEQYAEGKFYMKKLIAALLTVTLALTPVGHYVFQDQATSADARGYKSGKRSFNTNQGTNNSLFQNKNTNKSDSSTINKSTTKPNNGTTTAKRGFTSGGFMKGLMLGGLAGLLFGGLFGNMGALGSLLGLLVNVIAIVIIISIIRKIFVYFMDKKKKKDEPNPWRN